MQIEQQIKDITKLEIGNEKLKTRFKFNWKFKNIKDWFIGITINF